MSLNSVVIIGRLVRDPELKYANSGTAIGNFTVAVDRYAKAGEEKKTDFIKVICFGKQAENVAKFLGKGSECAVEGSIQTGSYEKDGRTVYTTEVLANRVQFIGGKAQNGSVSEAMNGVDTRAYTEGDLPF